MISFHFLFVTTWSYTSVRKICYSFDRWPMATIYSCGVWKIFVEIKKTLLCVPFFNHPLSFPSPFLTSYSCMSMYIKKICWSTLQNGCDRREDRKITRIVRCWKNLWHSSTWIYRSQQNSSFFSSIALCVCPFYDHHSTLFSRVIPGLAKCVFNGWNIYILFCNPTKRFIFVCAESGMKRDFFLV